MGTRNSTRKVVSRVRVDLPNYTDLQQVKCDWTSVYGDISEELPKDMPVPHGKPVITTTYEDANLYHDYLTGRSVTGILHLVNQTPVDWYCKRQAMVEMATYGSEFNVARTATEQIMGYALYFAYVRSPGSRFLYVR